MKKSKWLALAGVALLSVGALAACSSKSSTSGTTYGYVYNSDPETLDYITSNTGPTKTAVTNGVDGLMEADKYGNLVPSVAEDWSVSQFLSSSKNDLPKLRSSKYLQSHFDGFYKSVKEALKTEKPVLVCGSPCQMAAMFRYLKKPYENLIIVDYICRGIASPMYFRKWRS